jgi:hypothetical protein
MTSRSRVSAIGYLIRVFRFRCWSRVMTPNLITRTWRLKPVTRDPKCFQPPTANRQPLTPHLTTFFHPSIVSFSSSLGSVLMP